MRRRPRYSKEFAERVKASKKKKENKRKARKAKRENKETYKIFLFRNNRYSCYKGKYSSEEQGLRALERMSNRNKQKVDLSREHNFTYLYKDGVKLDGHVLKDIYYELLLVKELKDGETLPNPILKNNIGEYVEHKIVNNDKYVIVSKAPYYVEETFYVFGLDSRRERKKFKDIFVEYVAPRASNILEMLNIQLFRNKLLLEGSSSSTLIICKCKSDAIRLYNKIEEFCKSTPQFKYILYSGDCDYSRASKKRIMDKIAKITNWPYTKIALKKQ